MWNAIKKLFKKRNKSDYGSALIPIYVDPKIMEACTRNNVLRDIVPVSFWTPFEIKRKYGKHPAIRIDKFEIRKFKGLCSLIPRIVVKCNKWHKYLGIDWFSPVRFESISGLFNWNVKGMHAASDVEEDIAYWLTKEKIEANKYEDDEE